MTSNPILNTNIKKPSFVTFLYIQNKNNIWTQLFSISDEEPI